MISRAEAGAWAERFGVAPAQIERDHFISHVLAALHDLYPETCFVGGTALCRTYLEGSRLSEDIDLLHVDPQAFLDVLAVELPRALRREFPTTSWTPLPPERDGFAAQLSPPELTAIKIYAGRDGPSTGAWRFTPTDVHLRYRDLAPVLPFQCPSRPTFVAMKMAAWCDRHAPRDLFDLAGLAAIGAIADPDAGQIFRAKMGFGIGETEFVRVPGSTAKAWETELRAQVGSLPGPAQCLAAVRAALTGAGRQGAD